MMLPLAPHWVQAIVSSKVHARNFSEHHNLKHVLYNKVVQKVRQLRGEIGQFQHNMALNG
jgi:hypothetical protein